MKIQKLTPFVFFLSGFLMPMAYGQTPTPTARDVISEVIEQAAKETSKNEKPAAQPSSSAAAETREDQYWCDKLLKAPIEKYLPNGYSNPKISLTEMTPSERAGGMRSKISVALQGPDSFNAIRYRIYENEAAADRGLKSLSKGLPPDIAVIDGKMWFAHHLGDPEVPCMAFTAGNRTLTFVTCADQRGGIVVSGVASQPNTGNSYQQDTIIRAGRLLETGIASLEAQAKQDLDEVWEKVFPKDQKK